MKFTKFIGPAVFLMLGTGANVYAQHAEEGKEQKPENKAEPQQRQPQQQHAQQSKPQAPPPQHAQQPKQQVLQPKEQQPQPQQRQAQHAVQPKPDAAAPRQQAHQQTQQKPQQQQHAQSQQPAQHQQASQQGGQRASYTPPLRTRQQAQTWQQKSGWRQDGAWQEHASWQQDRSSNWQSDHRTWAQRGGYGGYYIPQASFSLHFGEGNWFRIQSQPLIVGGYPRFQYGGYSFMMVDPWPADWAENWYAADDVYVGYDNGYYLYNRAYPGEGIAISVVL